MLCAKDFYLTCSEPNKTGLFEQCQEVVILRKSGNQIQVYSKPNQNAFQVHGESLFQATSIADDEILNPGDLLVLGSQNLWNTSKVGFDSLCKLDKKPKGELLTVSCGRYHGETINRNEVFKFQAVNENSITTPAAFRP